MRWVVLALSLGASVMSMIHGVIAMLLSSGTAARTAPAVPGSGFTWLTGVLLFTSVVLALIGGYLVFNRRRIGGIFLVLAAAICFFAHHDTRIYGGLYLAGGILSFFVRHPSRYEDEDYEGDEDEYGDDEEPDDEPEEEKPSVQDTPGFFRNVSYGGRRKERAGKIINKEDRQEYGFRTEESGIAASEKVRVRSTKVCPACGASVGVDHKFCFICGGSLHTNRIDQAETVENEVSAAMVDEFLTTPTTLTPEDEERIPFRDFQPILPTDEEAAEPEEELMAPGSGESQNERGERSVDDFFEFDMKEISEGADASASHRVFVKPVRDEQPVPRRSLRIEPDNSYQEFSNYTRRRKRNNRSMMRRVVGLLVLLCVVGGIAWFLLGLRKLPPKDIPVQIPSEDVPVAGERRSSTPSPDPVAVPVNGRSVPAEEGSLPALRPEAPSRGAIVGTNVNIRSDHSTAGAVVTRLSTGARAELLDRWEGTSGNLTGPWYKIRSGGKEGWIYGQFFVPMDARDTTLPAGYTAALLKSFGAGKTAMTNQLGQPSRRTGTTLRWSGIVADFKNDNEASRLQITGVRHVLQNGVVVGMPEETLYKNIGYPSDYKSGQLRYLESSGQGMAVSLKDGKIQSITAGNI